MYELPADLESDLQSLSERVERDWRPLSYRQRENIWAASVAQRWQASSHEADEHLKLLWAEAFCELSPLGFADDLTTNADLLLLTHQKVIGAKGASAYRHYDLGNEEITFAPASEISGAVAHVLLQARAFKSPVARAAYLGQALLSIHPFTDANGRTVRLFVDLYLLHAEYPPPYYDSPMDFLLANSWRAAPRFSFAHAVRSVGSALTRSLDMSLPG